MATRTGGLAGVDDVETVSVCALWLAVARLPGVDRRLGFRRAGGRLEPVPDIDRNRVEDRADMVADASRRGERRAVEECARQRDRCVVEEHVIECKIHV